MTAIDCTFVSTSGSTVYLEPSSTTRVSNCTFTTDTRTAGHDNFIYTSGAHVDYGNCTPGRNPGASGVTILVSDGSFTGCPFACPLGTRRPNSHATGDADRLRGGLRDLPRRHCL